MFVCAALLALCVVSFVLCSYFATTLKLPDSSDVRLLGENLEFEKAASWRKDLLATDLLTLRGSDTYVLWGVSPDDTGDLCKMFEFFRND